MAATVGRLLQSLANTRQVLCVTHLPQVAAYSDHHYLVQKQDSRETERKKPRAGDAAGVSSELSRLSRDARIDELARMLGGTAITAKTRAHAKELFEQHRRGAGAANQKSGIGDQ